jgi:hypothetical protein
MMAKFQRDVNRSIAVATANNEGVDGLFTRSGMENGITKGQPHGLQENEKENRFDRQ